jgi:hypothetical protein
MHASPGHSRPILEIKSRLPHLEFFLLNDSLLFHSRLCATRGGRGCAGQVTASTSGPSAPRDLLDVFQCGSQLCRSSRSLFYAGLGSLLSDPAVSLENSGLRFHSRGETTALMKASSPPKTPAAGGTLGGEKKSVWSSGRVSASIAARAEDRATALAVRRPPAPLRCT